jgi:hypothetical protein
VSAITTEPPKQNDWPLYWFAKLEHAVNSGDYAAAADAQRQLDRLGVRVAYGRPSAGEGRRNATR